MPKETAERFLGPSIQGRDAVGRRASTFRPRSRGRMLRGKRIVSAALVGALAAGIMTMGAGVAAASSGGESEFVIAGYTPPQGSRTELGALLVGLYDSGKLRFTGKVGTGYTQETLRDLGAKLQRLRTDTPSFDQPPRVKDAIWVKPRLVAQIAYAEWTADGKLRQPAFLGLRADKSPEECTWARRE